VPGLTDRRLENVAELLFAGRLPGYVSPGAGYWAAFLKFDAPLQAG
jgi:hypothetical protein